VIFFDQNDDEKTCKLTNYQKSAGELFLMLLSMPVYGTGATAILPGWDLGMPNGLPLPLNFSENEQYCP
jgi:hypothetical protein